MVWVCQSVDTRKWGIQVTKLEKNQVLRVLMEEYIVNSPNEVFKFLEEFKSPKSRRIIKDSNLKLWGFEVEMTNYPVFKEIGYETEEGVNLYLKELDNALNEDIKMKPDVFKNAKVMKLA